MHGHVESLREPRDWLPAEPPARVAIVGDVAVAVQGTCYGSWFRWDGEWVAMSAAFAALVARIGADTDWPAALAEAFVAARTALDALPVEDIEWAPGVVEAIGAYATLTCTVVTPRRCFFAWGGDIIAHLLDERRLLRATRAHTYIRQRREARQPIGPNHPRRECIVGSVHKGPEIVAWPPLAPGQRLVLGRREMTDVLRHDLPPRTPGSAWLRAVLARDEVHDKVGVLIEA